MPNIGRWQRSATVVFILATAGLYAPATYLCSANRDADLILVVATFGGIGLFQMFVYYRACAIVSGWAMVGCAIVHHVMAQCVVAAVHGTCGQLDGMATLVYDIVHVLVAAFWLATVLVIVAFSPRSDQTRRPGFGVISPPSPTLGQKSR